MPRVSNKENKNIYFTKREELKLTRDQASELLQSIPPERIEKIENERDECDTLVNFLCNFKVLTDFNAKVKKSPSRLIFSKITYLCKKHNN